MAAEPQRAPGMWVPYAILSLMVPFLMFAIAFIGTVRVADQRLLTLEEKGKILDRRLDEALVARHEIENRLTRLESR